MKEKLILYFPPFFTGVVILVIFLTIDLPKINEILSVRQRLNNIQERLSKLSNKEKLLSVLNVNDLNDKYKKISLVLPDGKDAPSILRNLEASASYSGVILAGFSFTPGKIATESPVLKAQDTNELSLKISVKGAETQMVDYLKKITFLGRAMTIKSVSLDLKSSSDSASLGLDANAHLLIPPAKEPQIDDPLVDLNDQEKEALNQVLNRDLLLPQVIIASSSGKLDLFQ